MHMLIFNFMATQMMQVLDLGSDKCIFQILKSASMHSMDCLFTSTTPIDSELLWKSVTSITTQVVDFRKVGLPKQPDFHAMLLSHVFTCTCTCTCCTLS